MHIAVSGNIGSGKTTLTGMLAKHFNWDPMYENTDNNPYLASFYEDMQRWSFNLQIYFLNKRFRQIVDIHKKKKHTIQDRTIYEDAYIFAPNLHNMGLMASRDFENYKSLFELMGSFIQPPDLLIYLQADTSTLVAQIQKRGRNYENSIRIDYLQGLNKLYEQWITLYEQQYVRTGQSKLLTIDINTIKFAEKAEDFGTIIEKINAELFGLFK
ncbi:MAG: deoxynucleoside kinase [Bacteroidales bacterium]|jgi:deoxyadenosine/deoxycytidine kinase|nr:deoxynucleoside kinase [Bacteroidales bacterium]